MLTHEMASMAVQEYHLCTTEKLFLKELKFYEMSYDTTLVWLQPATTQFD